eukprot:Hpha_TRINITY_DN33805_c0_g1::TRINITY_DN33805_c0_g1_i1::g.27495::m.27495/K10569/NEIL3; endonuclease VIII-like 3
MVEGPGATNNAKKARQLLGLRVQRAVGCSVGAGAVLKQVLKLGKTIWLVFSEEEVEYAIRLHFGMSGSLHLGTTRPRSNRAREALRLTFEGDRDLAVFSDGDTGGVRREEGVEDIRCLVVSRSHLDVCNPDFDPLRAAEWVANRGEGRNIATALLDQSLSPGTGNIIQMEGLHRARVHPLRSVESLGGAELLRAMKEVRKYAVAWLTGHRPECLVYNRRACVECGTPVKVLKDASTGNRVKFFCETCAPRNPP